MSCHFMFAFVILATTSTGSRLKPVFQHADVASQAKGGHKWEKDKMYMCTQKWAKSTGVYQDKWCLAEIGDVVQGTQVGVGKMRVLQGFSKCIAKSKNYRFKVCNLKGKQDRRLAYAEKVYVPKSCFMRLPPEFSYPTPSGKKVPLLTAAVGFHACKKMYSLSPSDQKRLTKDEDTSAVISKDDEPTEDDEVTTTTSMSEPASVDEDSMDEDTATSTTTMTEPDEDALDEDVDTIASEVIQKILAEDQVKEDELEDIPDTGDFDVEDENDNSVEESLETHEVHEEKEKSAELDVDQLAINQIRELWKKRDAKNPGQPH